MACVIADAVKYIANPQKIILIIFSYLDSFSISVNFVNIVKPMRRIPARTSRVKLPSRDLTFDEYKSDCAFKSLRRLVSSFAYASLLSSITKL